MLKWILPSIFLICGTVLINKEVCSCNEAVCGSVVSKCLLTQSCKCDMKNSTCYKDCSNCLGNLYSECCSCVDLCPKPNETENVLSKKSHIEEFRNPVPELFLALTESPNEKWNSITFPIDIDTSHYGPKKEIKIHMQTAEQEVFEKSKDTITINCTVAFWYECMSWPKCRSGCQTMGAESFRWFHDGCCECIGPRCINYGINESKCKNCPLKDGVVIDEDIDEDSLDYGENDDDNEME